MPEPTPRSENRSVVAIATIVIVRAVAVALACVLRLIAPFGDAARAILPAVVVATAFHPALGSPAFRIPALVGALAIGALPIALLGGPALLIPPLFRPADFVAALIRSALGGATLFHAAGVGSVPRGVSTLLDAAAFGTLGGRPSLVAVVLVTTIGAGLCRPRLTVWRIAVTRRAGTNSVLMKLPRLLAEDNPAAIRLIIPTAVHQIGGLPAVIRRRITLDALRWSVDVRDGLVVDQLSARMRHAARQRGRQRYSEPQRVKPSPNARCSIPWLIRHGILRLHLEALALGM